MTISRFSIVPRTLLAAALLAGGWQSSALAGRNGTSPDGLWTLQARTPNSRPDLESMIPASKFQAFTADLESLKATLAAAPLDQATADALGVARKGRPVELSLPLPRQGKFATFKVTEVAIMAPELAAKFPDIKTYRGVGVDNPRMTLALDVTPHGMHAQIISPEGSVYISPYYFAGADDVYASYRKADSEQEDGTEWACEFTNSAKGNFGARVDRVSPQTVFGGSLRTYRLACAANHQYVATTGGTVASGQAEVVTIINRVSAIYEAEMGIRLVLIANNNTIIYPDAATDPYSNTTAALSQNQTNLTSVIGAANYDIGHVFTTGSGGVAGLGVVCNNNQKARGTTGLPNPKGDDFAVDYVVHEMGHQFGANHTFNGGITSAGSCSGGNRSAAHAYEPGSGTTIMAYAGICGVNNNLQPHSDAYFHSESVSEILTYTAGTGGTCPVVTTNNNTAPTVDAGLDYSIPLQTPFTLTGSAVDAENNILTYCWEERDRGTVQSDANAADDGTSPLFRSFTPIYATSRTFPKVTDIINNTATIGEKLPAIARTMNFRLTVRDNRTNGGATNSDDAVITAVAGTGPFVVSSPNTAITVARGSALPVTWSVANTNLPPISTTAVNILLSTDGGYTFPTVLAAGVPNSGSATVTLPAGVTSSTARVKVAAAGNVYFDISDANFTIN